MGEKKKKKKSLKELEKEIQDALKEVAKAKDKYVDLLKLWKERRKENE